MSDWYDRHCKTSAKVFFGERVHIYFFFQLITHLKNSYRREQFLSFFLSAAPCHHISDGNDVRDRLPSTWMPTFMPSWESKLLKILILGLVDLLETVSFMGANNLDLLTEKKRILEPNAATQCILILILWPMTAKDYFFMYFPCYVRVLRDSKYMNFMLSMHLTFTYALASLSSSQIKWLCIHLISYC